MATRIRARRPALATLDTRKVRLPQKQTEPFYKSPEWRKLVAEVIRERGRQCEAPGCGETHGRIYADHVVERKDGGADLDKRNIQLLCHRCHEAKGAIAARARRERVALEGR